MKLNCKTKVLSFVLAFVMLYTALPFRNLIVRAIEESETPESLIGAVGEFVKANTVELWSTPDSDVATDVQYYVNYGVLPEKVVITDTYVGENGQVWYELDPMIGCEWPSTFDHYRWVKAEVIKITAKEGATVLVDEDENPITSITMSKYDRVSISAITTLHVTTSARARSSARGGYQWQICYDHENNLWVDIYGETDETIVLTYGMIASLLDGDSSVQVRCKTTDGTKTNVSDALTVVLAASDDAASTQSASGAASRLRTSATVSGDTPVVAADVTVAETHSIVVNYVFIDGTKVWEPWTATIAEGQPLPETTIICPTKPGYLPWVDRHDGSDEVQQDSFTLEYPDGITADITITVTYKPTNVNYTVKHYKQKIDSDAYDLIYTETREGLTESTVPEVHKEYVGFYHLLYEQPAIAADGSTEIEIYYDRYYYLMNFDMDGGYGTEPIYARYETPIKSVTNPTKAGYSFEGWSETKGGTEKVTLPTTMPAGHKVYYAIWKVADTAKVTIVFWGENADDEKYSYLTKDKDIEDGGTDLTNVYLYLQPGTEFTYTDRMSLNCTKEEHTHTDTCMLKCGLDEGHSHTKDCYDGVGAETTVSNNAPSSPANGYVYSQYSWGQKYIYINGSWYNYSGSTANGNTAPTTCGKEESNSDHVHNAECYYCGKTEHTHSALGGSCYTLTCDIESHTHSTSCYAGVDDATWSGSTGKPDNPSEGQVYSGRLGTYIYIGGTWYDYTGTTASGSIAPTTCGKEAITHTHTDSCYTLTCGTEEHTHTDACYNCGKEEHTHGVDCRKGSVALDNTLWKFIKSDTVTVAADGSTVVNVYYDRVEYSVQFYQNMECSDNKEYTNLKITAKWGENILDKWPTYNGSSSWKVKDKENTWQNSIQVMPVGGAKYWGPLTGNSKYTATYYVEILDGESYDVKGSDGRYYKVHHTDTSVSSGNVTDEERYGIDGFTINNDISTKNGSSYGGAKFYYTRNSYTLTFNDGYNDVKKESVKYEASLGTYKDYVPEVPSAYEPGSVEFGGWYQNPQCTGEEYKLDEHIMPANDLILYAKWIPVTHTITFYLTEKNTDIYHPEDAEDWAQFTVPHGDNIAEEYVNNHLTEKAMNDAKPNGAYQFVVWYYYENGEQVPFDPTSPVRKDMTLYGKWISNTLKQYTVQYVLKDDHSVKVAEDLVGSGLAGTTKTFDAKGGTDLYAAYQEGYFPTVRSKSLLLDIESDSLVVIFEYVPMPAVPYTVKYVDKDTGASLAEDKVVSDNRKAVVTETFKPISGYMPDAYQKQLVVTAEGENILYFYYTRDAVHAYYKITHYIQNLDGETWTEYASSQLIGDIGTRYTSSPMTIPGYKYQEIKYFVDNEEVTDVTPEGAKLTADGLEINLYYVRNRYPYKVEYLEQGTNQTLHDPTYGNGLYGQIISESAININGYDKVPPTSATISIKIETDTEAKLNIITFYYKQKTVDIKYVAVGPEGATDFGSVSPESETVKIKTGLANGSIPTPGPNFRFVGWYLDEACTQRVDPSWVVTNNKIQPQKKDGVYEEATYYAKFEYNLVSLTVKKEGAKEIDKNQTFIFHIKGNENDVDLTVTVHGNGSVKVTDLPIGTYTVTEMTDWSWRYEIETWTFGEQSGSDAAATITLNQAENTITFKNKREKTEWLDGNTFCQNVFAK